MCRGRRAKSHLLAHVAAARRGVTTAHRSGGLRGATVTQPDTARARTADDKLCVVVHRRDQRAQGDIAAAGNTGGSGTTNDAAVIATYVQ